MINYSPFWKTLKEKGVSTYKLINQFDVSSGTLSRMKKQKALTTTTIDDFCRILDCRVEDIIEYVKEETVGKGNPTGAEDK